MSLAGISTCAKRLVFVFLDVHQKCEHTVLKAGVSHGSSMTVLTRRCTCVKGKSRIAFCVTRATKGTFDTSLVGFQRLSRQRLCAQFHR